jgi:GNAT superfamily N-acetyltransferase
MSSGTVTCAGVTIHRAPDVPAPGRKGSSGRARFAAAVRSISPDRANFRHRRPGAGSISRVLVSVWSLQQCRPADLRPPSVRIQHATLIQVTRPSPELARFLYTEVGGRWGWQSRLNWTTAEWRVALERRGTELWMSWYRGRATGYVELAGGEGDGSVTRIRYLGLLPGFCGHGLGGQLLADATCRAWTVHLRTRTLPPVARVLVDTRELDSPAALANYLARGYQLVQCTQVNSRLIEDPCRVPEEARH